MVQLAYLLTDGEGTALAGEQFVIKARGRQRAADAATPGVRWDHDGGGASGVALAAALGAFAACLKTARTLVALISLEVLNDGARLKSKW